MRRRTYVCTDTVIIDGEYIYKDQEYMVNKAGNIIMDDDIILYPRRGELEKHGYFV